MDWNIESQLQENKKNILSYLDQEKVFAIKNNTRNVSTKIYAKPIDENQVIVSIFNTKEVGQEEAVKALELTKQMIMASR